MSNLGKKLQQILKTVVSLTLIATTAVETANYSSNKNSNSDDFNDEERYISELNDSPMEVYLEVPNTNPIDFDKLHIDELQDSVNTTLDLTYNELYNNMLIAFDAIKSSCDAINYKRELTLLEKEMLVRYLFNVENDVKWKECVATILSEGGILCFEESYNITTTVLNRLNSYLWGGARKSSSFYTNLTNGQFTAYNNPDCGYFTYFNMSIEALRKLDGYAGLVECLYSQIPSHNYGAFRSKGSPKGEQLVPGGNKYRSLITEDDVIPMEDRPYYQKIVEIMEDENNEFHELLKVVYNGEVSGLDFYNDMRKNQEENSQDNNLKYERTLR